jgi:hypothetical protein
MWLLPDIDVLHDHLRILKGVKVQYKAELWANSSHSSSRKINTFKFKPNLSKHSNGFWSENGTLSTSADLVLIFLETVLFEQEVHDISESCWNLTKRHAVKIEETPERRTAGPASAKFFFVVVNQLELLGLTTSKSF